MTEEGLTSADGGRVDEPAVPVGRLMAGVATVTVLGALAPFLLGSQSVWIREDLQFGQGRFGLVVSAFFAAAALSTIIGGNAVGALGRRGGAVLAGVLVALGGFGVAFLALGWWSLLALVALLGVANAVCQATANYAVAQAVPPHRRGLGFGIKQSAVPASIMLAGLLVPAVGVHFGWRAAFVLTGVGGLVLVVVALRMEHAPHPPRAARSGMDLAPRGPLLLCGIAVAFASAAANFLGTFLASWGHEVGLSVTQAALLMSAGSAASVVLRVAAGHRADRRFGRNLPVVAAQILVGALCLAMVAVPQPWTATLFGFLALAVGWSWPGLFLYAVARVGRDSPGSAAGYVQAGAFTGGAVGPALLGACIGWWGFQAAWLVAAGAFLTAGLLVLAAMVLLRRDLERRPPRERFGYGGGRTEPARWTGGPA